MKKNKILKNKYELAKETRHFFIKLIVNYQQFMQKHKFIRFSWKTFLFFFELFATALIVLTITFFFIDAAPGQPTITSVVSGAAARAIEEKYHLNDPLFTKWLSYMKGVFNLDFGISLSTRPGVPIKDFVWTRFKTSAWIGGLSLALTILIGIPIGVWAGRKLTGFTAFVSSFGIAIIISIPALVFALLFALMSRAIGLPYIFSHNNFLTWIMPSLALALSSSIHYVKYIRTTMNQEIISQHAKFAKLKGISSRRFIWRHALKPSLFPIVTFFPGSIIFIFTGSLFTERIFSIPGAGFLFTEAAQTKDTYVILFLSTLYTMLTIVSYRLRDSLYPIMDPRLRRKGV